MLSKVLRKNQFKKNFFVRQPNVQQQLQEIAKYMVNSRSSFARIFILAESKRLRSSPLLVAAKRCRSFPSCTKRRIALHRISKNRLEMQPESNTENEPKKIYSENVWLSF